MRYKPSSVPTRRRVTGEAGKAIYLDPTLPPGSPPTRAPAEAAYPRRLQPEPRHVAAWPCARWGLPCQAGHPACGALLPHHFTLTLRPDKSGCGAVSFLWHCPGPSRPDGSGRAERWALPTTAVQRRSDFPPPAATTRSGLPRIRPTALYRGRRGTGELVRRLLRLGAAESSGTRCGGTLNAGVGLFPRRMWYD